MYNHMIGIYKITNPKGKIYIGKSIQVESRIQKYKYNNPNQPKLNNSIKKYGFENHDVEIIEICKADQLDNREIHYINHYNSVEKGLNLTYGGEGGIPSKETRNKKSKSMMGKTHSVETRKKMSESKLNHSMYNNEWRQKMKKNTWFSPKKNVPICQYDLDNNLINEFKSLKEAATFLNKGIGGIGNALSGKAKTAYGYKWGYK